MLHQFFTSENTEEISDNFQITPAKNIILNSETTVFEQPLTNIGNEMNICQNNYMQETISEIHIIPEKVKNNLRVSASSARKKILVKGPSDKTMTIALSQKHIKPNVVKV